MIDAKDGVLVEGLHQGCVQAARRLQVRPEGLFDDDTRALCNAAFAKLLHHEAKESGWYRQIMCGVPERSEHSLDHGESLRLAIISVNVVQQFGKRFHTRTIRYAVFSQAL